MEQQDRAYLESLTDSNDIGFVGYRDYKNSKFFKEYREARAKLPKDKFAEATGREVEQVKPQKKHGRFAAFVTALLGLLFAAVCVCGYFLPEIEWAGELFTVYRGTDLIGAAMALINGKTAEVTEIVGCVTLLVATLIAVAAFIGGLIGLSGCGIKMPLKIGCVCLFLCVMATMACSIIAGAKIHGGFAVLILIGVLLIICTSLSSNKAKEKK